MYRLEYDNVILEDVVDGYSTTNIENDGLFSPDLNTITIDGRDGSYVVSQQLPARVIRIHFILKGENFEKKRRKLELLNFYLFKDKDVSINLIHLNLWEKLPGTYYGRYYKHKDITYDYFQGVGYFDIYCQNPYKHMETLTYSGTDITVKTTEIYHKLQLESITGTASGIIEIRNLSNGDIIKMSSELTGEFKLTLDTITNNNEVISGLLDYEVSTWKGFTINSGDKISIKGLTSPTIKVRRLII